MVNRQSSDDWSRFTGKLSTDLEDDVQKAVKQAAFVTFMQSVFGFAFLAGTGALGLMFLNSIANSAWPNLMAFRPGIGYTDAFLVSSILWILFSIKLSMSKGAKS